MATVSITIPNGDSKIVKPDDSHGVNNDDTIDLTLEGSNQLTVEHLQVHLHVVTSEAGTGESVITSAQDSDLSIRHVQLNNGQTLKYNVDHESSLTYNAKADQLDALESSTFHFMGTTEGGDPGAAIKLVLPQPLDTDINPSITNLQPGDSLLIEIDDGSGTPIVPAHYQFNTQPSGVQLRFFDSEDNDLVYFDLPEGFNQDLTYEVDSNGNFVVGCYLRGTHIATPEGEKLVQDLQPDDQVLTASGSVATVKWLGHRTMYASRIPANHAIRAYPVCIAAGALAPNVPTRDLYVSPGHHMYFDGKLIPAMLLVNGKTITQYFSRHAFEYFHVELDRFDILLAEGAAAESYVDTGNRSTFENVKTVSMLADFGPAEGRPSIDGIQIARSGPAVEAVRKHLLKRAAAITKSTRVNDPDLKISVNGQEILPELAGQTEGVMRFVLPSGVQASDLHIVSRSAVVRETTWHARRDLRRVGVALASITIEDATGRREINVQDKRLRGLQPSQDVRGVIMRWTTGNAIIPATLHAIDGPAVIELDVRRTYSYWAPAQKLAA